MTQTHEIASAIEKFEAAVQEIFRVCKSRLGEDLLDISIGSPTEIVFTYHLLGQRGEGCGERDFLARHLADFLDDPVSFYATAHKVTREQYLAWMDAGATWQAGGVQCTAMTKAGRRCRGRAANAFTAREWVDRQGGYCAVHGGENNSS